MGVLGYSSLMPGHSVQANPDTSGFGPDTPGIATVTPNFATITPETPAARHVDIGKSVAGDSDLGLG